MCTLWAVNYLWVGLYLRDEQWGWSEKLTEPSYLYEVMGLLLEDRQTLALDAF